VYILQTFEKSPLGLRLFTFTDFEGLKLAFDHVLDGGNGSLCAWIKRLMVDYRIVL